MRLLRSLAIVAVLTTASAQGSNAETPEGAAEAAARVWLGLVDGGDYAKSWVTGAEYFRNSVLQAQWVTSVARVRGSLGSVKSRRLVSAKYTRSLHGAPAGEYAVTHFAASFEQRAEGTGPETPAKDGGARW